MLLGDNFLADLDRVAIRDPGQISNLIDRAQVRRRVAVTFQTEIHVQRLHLPHLDHLVHAAVAAHATDAGADMRAVIEVNVVGEAVYLNPGNRLAGCIAAADGLEQRACGLHARMAVHARFGRRNGRIGGLVDRRVAVVAIHTQIASMKFMAIRNRLFRRIAGLQIRGSCIKVGGCDAHNGANTEHGAKNLDIPINGLGEESRHLNKHFLMPWDPGQPGLQILL